MGTIVEKKYLTQDVMYLSLQVPQNFTFQAGQFVNMKMTLNGETKNRSFSILNPPAKQGFIDLCVKIIPGGFASKIFEQTNIGDEFPIKGPLGLFTFDEKSSHLENWFICTGTGITPFYSMIYEYLHLHPDKKFKLFFGVRTKDHLFFHQEFQVLEQKYPHFTFLPTLSREQWDGATGRVQQHLGEDLQNKTFYICGLKDLVLETKEYLLNHGVAPQDIHAERYT